ncbi:MAG: polyphosphate kinase 1 [Phycisphaerae bacterium]
MSKTQRSEVDLDAPELYINRELSWLEFNDRVLRQGLDKSLPLLERLKFLAIVSSNLDEFFLIRVAGLMQQRSAGIRKRDPAGFTPAQQLKAIAERVHRMLQEQTAAVDDALTELREHGLSILEPEEWTPGQRDFLRSHFRAEIQPVLTPLGMEELNPPPLLPSLQMNVGLLLIHKGQPRSEAKMVVVPIPGQFARFITIPTQEGTHMARLEDVVAANVGMLFEDCQVLTTAVFRITRDADVAIQDDEAGDLLQAVERAVLDRRKRAAVRLTISARPDRRIRKYLVDWLELRPEEVYEIDGMLDTASLMEIANRQGYDELKVPDWPVQPPRDLLGEENLWHALQDHDVLLFHPYESFDPVVDLVQEAAADPNVMAIKQTLYRTSGDSPIVKALEQAAENGKQVTVLVELKARFDEARNVVWARRLEDAGCHVIYGVAGYKTHAKALLIVRREATRIHRYVHVSTGNYNDKTAKLYSDVGLMTADGDLAGDVSALFNLLTGYSEIVGWSKLTIAPTDLRRRIVELIDREIQVSTPDRPGRINAKINSLQDKGICKALYRASMAGVKVRLNVRGICCLRPGVKGVSDNIEVTSIVDRYLEHARIFHFHNGGHDELYLSSADWMTRNLDKRLETLFPVIDPALRRRLRNALETYFADDVKSRRLLPDGTYQKVPTGQTPLRAQEALYQQAVEAARRGARASVRFRPLTRPED